MFKRLIETIRKRREKELEEYKQQVYIQRRVIETQKEMFINRKHIDVDKNKKSYFFDSRIYGEVFK